MQDERVLEIPPALDGLRFDQALAELLPEYSRSRLQQWIRAGQILLDDEARTPRARVSAGSAVQVRVRPQPADPHVQAQPIALDVVHACTRDDKDVEQLSALVGRDPVLSAELLRIANSAYFGFASEINSVARAINIIGHQALRNIALCIAVRDTLKPDQLPGFPLGEFWEATLRRAVCARSLAGLADLDAETGFTVGLLQDFGLEVPAIGTGQAS